MNETEARAIKKPGPVRFIKAPLKMFGGMQEDMNRFHQTNCAIESEKSNLCFTVISVLSF